ncbi:hypothetical protein Aduo_016705 [Ancylostoma duodenale]
MTKETASKSGRSSDTLPDTSRRADVQFGMDLVSTYARYNTFIPIDTKSGSFQTFDVEAMIREISCISDEETPLYRALCGNVALAFSHNSLAEELASLKKTVERLETKLDKAILIKMEEGGSNESDNNDREVYGEVEEAEDEEPANPNGQNQVEVENTENKPVNNGGEAVAVFGQFPCPMEPFLLKSEKKCRGVDLNEVYSKLVVEFEEYKKDYAKFFFKEFVNNVCKEGYIEDDWKLLRVANINSNLKMIDIDHRTIIDFVKATYEAGGKAIVDGFKAKVKEQLTTTV